MAESGQATLKPITVLLQFTDERDQLCEDRYDGFLVHTEYAMFVDEYRSLCLCQTVPTNEASVYLSVSKYFQLGSIDNANKPEDTMKLLTQRLQEMSGFEFVTQVLLHVKVDVEFDDLLIPQMMGNEKSPL